jgi:uncharacterized membrane protein YfcA
MTAEPKLQLAQGRPWWTFIPFLAFVVLVGIRAGIVSFVVVVGSVVVAITAMVVGVRLHFVRRNRTRKPGVLLVVTATMTPSAASRAAGHLPIKGRRPLFGDFELTAAQVSWAPRKKGRKRGAQELRIALREVAGFEVAQARRSAIPFAKLRVRLADGGFADLSVNGVPHLEERLRDVAPGVGVTESEG